MASLRPNNHVTNTPPPPARATATTITNSSNNGAMAKNQFDAWAREKANWTKAAEAADRQRAAIDQTTANLRAVQQELIHRMHATSNKVGSVESEIKTLEQHKKRLKQQYTVERQELEDCARELEVQAASGRQKNREYCDNMKTANDEWGRVLKKHDDNRLKHMVGMTNLEHVMNSYGTAGIVDKPDAMERLEAAVDLFKQEIDKYQKAEARLGKLDKRLDKMRKQAKQIPLNSSASGDMQYLTEDALYALEQTWKNRMAASDDDESAPEKALGQDSITMDLFYGNQSQESSVAE